MSILTDKEIKELINKGELIINADPSCVSPSSYDLRIGTIFRDGKIINKLNADSVIVNPGEVVTMLTLETLELPANIAATAYAINSQSLEGFLVLNPGHVDPGYKGTLSIKALNLRKKGVPQCLSVGDKIFTVVFQEIGKNVEIPYSKHHTAKSREVREKEINKNEVEKSMKSIADLMSFTVDDLDDRIAKHQSTKLNDYLAKASAILTLITVIFSALALIFSALSYFKDDDKAITGLNVHSPEVSETQPQINESAGQPMSKASETTNQEKLPSAIRDKK